MGSMGVMIRLDHGGLFLCALVIFLCFCYAQLCPCAYMLSENSRYFLKADENIFAITPTSIQKRAHHFCLQSMQQYSVQGHIRGLGGGEGPKFYFIFLNIYIHLKKYIFLTFRHIYLKINTCPPPPPPPSNTISVHAPAVTKCKINLFLKSLCIQLSIEHSTTCDSRTHLNYMEKYVTCH